MNALAVQPASRSVRCGRLLQTTAGLIDLPTGQPARLSTERVREQDSRTWQASTCWSQPARSSAAGSVCVDAWLSQDWLGRWVARGVHLPASAAIRASTAGAAAVWPPGAWCGPSVVVGQVGAAGGWLALAAAARREGVVPIHLHVLPRLAGIAPDGCPPLLVGVPWPAGAVPPSLEAWLRRGGRVQGCVRLPAGAYPPATPPAGATVAAPDVGSRVDAGTAMQPRVAREIRALRRAWRALDHAPLLPSFVRVALPTGERATMTHQELLDVSTQLEDVRQDAEAVQVACRAARAHLRAAHAAILTSTSAADPSGRRDDPRLLASDGPAAESPLAWRQLCRGDGPADLVSADGWHAAVCHVVEQGRVWVCGRWPTRSQGLDTADLLGVFARLVAARVAWEEASSPGRADHLLIGDSVVMRDVRAQIGLAARAPFPVLIRGESGCGKELAARAIHGLGPRRHRRLAAINCAALPDDLIESELFGHVRGAFTGAASDRPGLFDEADGGTLFLDEVGELGGRAQAKLLRVLQDGEVRRVGENHSRRVDVRIIAATNVSLEDAVRRGAFRADLFYRLDVVRVRMPALRERRDDVAQLARHFWHDCTARLGSRARLEGRVVEALARYDWPGNVRQLQNTLAALAVRVPPRGRVTVDDLPPELRVCGAVAGDPGSRGLDAARRQFEASFVREALTRAGGRPSTAARDLGLTRQGLTKLVRRLGLDEAGPGSRLP